MDRNSLIFCGGAIGLSLLIAAVAYPFAAISEEKITRAKSVVQADSLGELDLGEYGKVTVSDLVSYYIENPPAPVAAGAPQRKVRFEGC